MKQIFLTLLALIFLSSSTAYCMLDVATGEEIKGYRGELPDVTARFQRQVPKVAKPKFEAVDTFNAHRGLKPIPRDNPAYINVMLKKDKLSQYANDINEIIPIVEKVIDSIDKNESEQLFTARVNYLYDDVDYLKRKYANRPERYYESYDDLVEVSIFAKSVILLRNEAKTYSPYCAYSAEGYMYNPKYINAQMQTLKTRLEKTLLILRRVE